jgi:hypothetical protein
MLPFALSRSGAALEPLLAGIEGLSEQIRECNERIERLAEESYPECRGKAPARFNSQNGAALFSP